MKSCANQTTHISANIDRCIQLQQHWLGHEELFKPSNDGGKCSGRQAPRQWLRPCWQDSRLRGNRQAGSSVERRRRGRLRRWEATARAHGSEAAPGRADRQRNPALRASQRRRGVDGRLATVTTRAEPQRRPQRLATQRSHENFAYLAHNVAQVDNGGLRQRDHRLRLRASDCEKLVYDVIDVELFGFCHGGGAKLVSTSSEGDRGA